VSVPINAVELVAIQSKFSTVEDVTAQFTKTNAVKLVALLADTTGKAILSAPCVTKTLTELIIGLPAVRLVALHPQTPTARNTKAFPGAADVGIGT
jgi:hypothetical protein